MMMKTANALLEELLDYVAPPRGCAIYLAESDPRDETETNGQAVRRRCLIRRLNATLGSSPSCAGPTVWLIGLGCQRPVMAGERSSRNGAWRRSSGGRFWCARREGEVTT